MTIEEKAKAYDEAIKIAKETYNTQPMYRNWLESMFPELQENEIKDMREKLIKAFGSIGKKEWGGVNVKDVIHWLEKQGEKKPTSDTRYKVSANGSLSVVNGKPFDHEKATITQKDFAPKAEPKFKVGDYIVSDYCMGRVVKITNDAYLLDTEQGIPFSCEHNAHLWTIEDAKDGDVLAEHECLVLFKNIAGLNIRCYCTYHFMNNPSFYVDTLQNKNAFHPATKEQRELLFKKMEEAGYEWNDEKKELKKINQNPTWSEEDDYNLQCMIAKVTSDIQKGNVGRNNELIDWLKSLKDRMKGKEDKQ